MTVFILRFIVFSGLLYLTYHLLFSKMSFFKLNRGILLLIPVVSLLIPLVAPLFEAPAVARAIPVFDLNEIVVNGETAGSESTTVSNINWYWVLYFIGNAGILTSIILGFAKAWRILQNSTPAFENVLVSQEASGPFAFFNKIVIPSSLIKSEKLDTIISHEKAHVEQNHGYDNLYYNLLSAVLWFNPFIHLLSRELRQTHECLADEAALEKTSPESYAQLLLSTAFGSEISFDAANRFFNSSLIKTRITMIYKTKTNRKMKGLYLLLIPILTGMTVGACDKNEVSSADPDKRGNTDQAEIEKLLKDVSEGESEAIGFAEADQPPLFPGCDENAPKEEQLACFQQGIIKHVQENFEYPDKAKEQKMQGKLFVSFAIDQAGNVRLTKVVRGLAAETAEEKAAAKQAEEHAIALVGSLPRLEPATVSGKKTAVSFTLPINLQLPEE